MNSGEITLKLLLAGERLSRSGIGPAPALFQSAMEGEPDNGLWRHQDVKRADSWLAHTARLPGAKIKDLREAVAYARRQAALN